MRKTSLFFLFCAFALGCNYNHVKSSPSQNTGGPQVTSMSLDFLTLQSTVLNSQCLRCHSSAGGNQGGLGLENYQQIRANLNKIYYRAIEKKDMPPSSMPPEQFEMLKNWLEAGAPLKSASQNSGPIKGAITWQVVQKQILGSSCLDCHSGANPDGKLQLDSAEVVRKNINAIFEAAIIKQTMPLEPYPALTEGQKQALMKWISQGMPD